MKVAFNDFRAHHARHAAGVEAAIERVLASGWFVLGGEVAGFEERLAGWLGGGRVVGCASGTDALVLALMALEVGPGDEVVTTALTAYPTVTAIEQVGATPVVVDVLEGSGLIDPGRVAAAIGLRTRAIVPVHLYGRACDMTAVLEVAGDVPVVEDCAQSIGARHRGRTTGLLGRIGCFSFYPTKNLGAYGDGGAVATADEALAGRLGRMRNYGQTSRYEHAERGINSRLDEIQAAILSAKLVTLAADNERRRTIAARYRESLDPSILFDRPEPEESVEHLFPVRVDDREVFRARLDGAAIETLVHYPVPVHRQPAFRGRLAGPCPVAERLAGQVVSLPLRPEMTDPEVDRVIEAVQAT